MRISWAKLYNTWRAWDLRSYFYPWNKITVKESLHIHRQAVISNLFSFAKTFLKCCAKIYQLVLWPLHTGSCRIRQFPLHAGSLVTMCDRSQPSWIDLVVLFEACVLLRLILQFPLIISWSLICLCMLSFPLTKALFIFSVYCTYYMYLNSV